MIELQQHGDVTALRFTWWRSRLIGYAVHAFLVRGVLVDTGFPAVQGDLRTFVTERPHPERIRGALVTHQHEDHAGNVALLAELGVPIGLDARTLAYARAPKPIGFYRHFTWRQMRPVRGDVIPFDDPSLELTPTPGHSPDHHVVWDHETRTLFAGDLFLGVKVRVAHRYEDPRAGLQSIQAMIARNPARMFCAHRGLVRDPVSALTAKADWLETTIDAIERLALTGASEAEIRARVLGERGFTHYVSRGDYSPDNFVRAVLRLDESNGVMRDGDCWTGAGRGS